MESQETYILLDIYKKRTWWGTWSKINWNHRRNKAKLVEHLNDILHSICRPTTFMLKSPTKSSKELYIDDYEILDWEPLHDITNIIQHLIEELPYHIENLEARQDLEKNASNIIGEKPNEGIRCPALCGKISNVYYHETWRRENFRAISTASFPTFL